MFGFGMWSCFFSTFYSESWHCRFEPNVTDVNIGVCCKFAWKFGQLATVCRQKGISPPTEGQNLAADAYGMARKHIDEHDFDDLNTLTQLCRLI